jgi:tetratricopeptide (TPR) repeat protein
MHKMLAAKAAFLLSAAFVLGAADMNRGSSTPTPPSTSSRSYDPAAEYQKGMEALKARRFEDAKKSFTKVYADAARDPSLNTVLGITYMELSDYKGALKYLEKAVKLDKKLILAHEQLGVTYAKLGDRAKAEAELATLKQLQAACGTSCPDADKLSRAVGSITTALGQPQAAIKPPGELLFASAEAGDTAYLEAVSLIHERRYEEALRSLHKAREVFGAHPDILTYLGFANRKLGRYAVAEDYYRQALAAAPNHKGATEYFGELMVERGNLTGARAMLAKLDRICTFGCAEADELRLWIKEKRAPST